MITTAAAVATAIAVGWYAVALRLLFRLFNALRYGWLLRDPVRAALVPPLDEHLRARTPTPGRAAWNHFAFGSVVSVVFVLAFLARRETAGRSAGDDLSSLAALAVGLLLACGAFLLAVGSVRRLVRARRVERMSQAGARDDGVVEQGRLETASTIPPLVFTSPSADAVSYRTLMPVTGERNIFGRRPWEITYLRVFDNENGLKRFLESAWRACGYVHLIRSATSVGAAELEAIESGSMTFIDSHRRLDGALDAHPRAPLPAGDRELTSVAADPVKVKDDYGSYPVRSLLCHEGFWKEAIDVLIGRAEVVVIDLSGYHWENVGTGYELERVIDRFPIANCVVIADPHLTDRKFLEAQIQKAWRRMAKGSPNASGQARELLVAPLMMPNAGMDIRYFAVARLLQQRLDGQSHSRI
jgi:hypothetical protein